MFHRRMFLGETTPLLPLRSLVWLSNISKKDVSKKDVSGRNNSPAAPQEPGLTQQHFKEGYFKEGCFWAEQLPCCPSGIWSDSATFHRRMFHRRMFYRRMFHRRMFLGRTTPLLPLRSLVWLSNISKKRCFIEGCFIEGCFTEGCFIEGCFTEGCFIEGCFIEGCFWAEPLPCCPSGIWSDSATLQRRRQWLSR